MLVCETPCLRELPQLLALTSDALSKQGLAQFSRFCSPLSAAVLEIVGETKVLYVNVNFLHEGLSSNFELMNSPEWFDLVFMYETEAGTIRVSLWPILRLGRAMLLNDTSMNAPKKVRL